jgi:hypothetical protein
VTEAAALRVTPIIGNMTVSQCNSSVEHHDFRFPAAAEDSARTPSPGAAAAADGGRRRAALAVDSRTTRAPGPGLGLRKKSFLRLSAGCMDRIPRFNAVREVSVCKCGAAARPRSARCCHGRRPAAGAARRKNTVQNFEPLHRAVQIFMEKLREDLVRYRSLRPSSASYKINFGDWPSVSRLIKRAAEGLEPGSREALRLRELSLCRDSRSSTPLNSKRVGKVINQVFEIIQMEFFPDLPSACDKENWIAIRQNGKPKVISSELLSTCHRRRLFVTVHCATD